MSKQREEGYYWVKNDFFEEWVVAHWDGGEWWSIGSLLSIEDDNEFSEIDERRIERKE